MKALAAKREEKATGERLRSERLKLFRDKLEVPLAAPRADWFACWRVIRVASQSGDLDAVVVQLVRAATAWRAAGWVCKAWVDAGKDWVAGAKSSCPHPQLCWPFHQPDDAVLVWWSAGVVTRHGLPIFAQLEASGDEYDFWVTVMQLIDDPATTEDQFREFFEYHPVNLLSSQAMTLAAAALPPPDGVALTADERPADDDGRIATRLLNQLVTLFQDPGDYYATAREFLGLNQRHATPPAEPAEESEPTRGTEPGCLSTARTTDTNPVKKPPGRPTLMGSKSYKLVVYRLIYDDMVRNPMRREPAAVIERVKGDSRIRGDTDWKGLNRLVKSAMKFIGRHKTDFPLTPPGQNPRPRR